MKEKPEVLQGTFALMVLKTPDVMGPQHSWGIAWRIEQVSGELLAVNPGILYPLLSKLEHDGAITSEWGASQNNAAGASIALPRLAASNSRQKPANGSRSRPLLRAFSKSKRRI
jgi:PadR family transcriptional regulator, regulatory protein PadR